MKFVCDGLDLSDAIQTTIKASSAKAINPILEGIKLRAYENKLELSATDLELSIVCTINAEVYDPGEVVVPGNFFSNYIKKLSGEQITADLDETNHLKLTYTDSEGFLQCYSSEEFPIIKNQSSVNYLLVPQNKFKAMINKTLFAVASDDSRPVLKGVLLETEGTTLNLVALDGYRMALNTTTIGECSGNIQVIIPARSLSEISKLLNDTNEPIRLNVEKNLLMLENHGTQITTRLIDGDFINYKKILPTEFTTTCVINKSQFENTLDRVSLLARFDKNNMVRFDMRENNLLITANSDLGNIKENINVTLNGKDLTCAFNSRYFTEALKAADDEFISLNLRDPHSPCIIKSVNNNSSYIHLILPVRIG